MLADAIIPIGDCIAVLSHGGTVAYALAVHGSAAVLVIITAVLLLREKQQHGTFGGPSATVGAGSVSAA